MELKSPSSIDTLTPRINITKYNKTNPETHNRITTKGCEAFGGERFMHGISALEDRLSQELSLEERIHSLYYVVNPVQGEATPSLPSVWTKNDQFHGLDQVKKRFIEVILVCD